MDPPKSSAVCCVADGRQMFSREEISSLHIKDALWILGHMLPFTSRPI